jgi:segregation and condensation protein B
MSLTNRIEALILASDEPLSMTRLRALLGANGNPEESEETPSADIRAALTELEAHYADRGIRLVQVGGGWQLRTAPEYAAIVHQLWQTRPPKLSRAMLETLAIIAYRQPTTRAEIEQLRGLKVSSNIIAGLQERGWIKVVGRKEVPGRPHLYGTGRQFLSDFGLNSLRDLPESSQLLDDEEWNAPIDETTEAIKTSEANEAIEDADAPTDEADTPAEA